MTTKPVELVTVPIRMALWRRDHDGHPVGEGPVSYTHLRAHETVLDLVCRLLLEKKKNKKLYTTYVYNRTNQAHNTDQEYAHT